jgi:hypothetical protein
MKRLRLYLLILIPLLFVFFFTLYRLVGFSVSQRWKGDGEPGALQVRDLYFSIITDDLGELGKRIEKGILEAAEEADVILQRSEDFVLQGREDHLLTLEIAIISGARGFIILNPRGFEEFPTRYQRLREPVVSLRPIAMGSGVVPADISPLGRRIAEELLQNTSEFQTISCVLPEWMRGVASFESEMRKVFSRSPRVRTVNFYFYSPSELEGLQEIEKIDREADGEQAVFVFGTRATRNLLIGLIESTKLDNYSVFGTGEENKESVDEGLLNAVWIFDAERMGSNMLRYVLDGSKTPLLPVLSFVEFYGNGE